MIRIVIIDDHGVLRDGISSLIRNEHDMKVVGEAGSGHDAVRLIMDGQCDLALLDVNLPDMDGMEVVRQVRSRGSRLPILILTMYQESYLALKLLQSGANGFINKQSLGEDLLKAIRLVAAGKRYLSEEMHEQLAFKLIDQPNREPHELLSPQERTILHMIAKGATVSRIAEELHLSSSTVTTYRRRIKEKLGIEGSTAELVRYAISHNMG
ncbi:MAG: response regulator transcription factor [Magnetococcales bacterium]|nr:response regulator transcription factor [Magnetococcales bacterium]